MQAFTRHTGVAAPILVDNVDTDQIIPSREMRRVSKTGLGEGLFAGWRYRYEDMEKVGLRPSFVLNQPEYFGTSILLGGKNFGCGSSREHAVWALREYGIRAIIAESFGRIFRSNCARNGLLAIEAQPAEIASIEAQVAANPQRNRVIVDLLENLIYTPGGQTVGFSVAASDREMLLNGLDHVEYTLQYEEAINAFVAGDRANRPWAYLEDDAASSRQ